MEETVRIRVVFEERHLLSKEQRSEGLRRCWILLRPELATVADLAAHVARRFSCSDGIVLSMDGFVLPPFESTCIFKDKDIVRINGKISKKKKKKLAICANSNHIQDKEIIEKQGISNNEVLSIEFKQSKQQEISRQKRKKEQEQDDTITSSERKQKEFEKPEGSRKKKPKLTTPEKPIIIAEIGKNQESVSTQLNSEMKDSTYHGDGNNTLDRKNQTELSLQANMSEPQNNDTTKKLTSRSARRKQAQRRKKQEEKRLAKEAMQSAAVELVQNDTNCATISSHQMSQELPKEGPQKSQATQSVPVETVQNGTTHCATTSSHQMFPLDSEVPDVIVPVVVRPGHIRFTSQDDDDDEGPSSVQLDGPRETFRWNGITSKAKGQKWGQTSKKHYNSNDFISNETTYGKNNISSENYDTAIGHYAQKNGNSNVDPYNLGDLSPLTRPPKEGDLIVYRVVELSSSWCPKLSPFRVGQVLIYDPISLRIILAPVPEYPILLEKKEENENNDEDTPSQQDFSPYKEDGSLEIEFPSLIDVKLLKDGGSKSATTNSNIFRKETNSTETAVGQNKASVNNSEGLNKLNKTNLNGSDTQNKDNPNNWETSSDPNIDNPHSGPTGNERSSQAQQNGWDTWANIINNNNNNTTTTPSWSYRALRGSALGPTIALLRGNINDNDNDNSSNYDNATRGGRGRGRGKRGKGRGN